MNFCLKSMILFAMILYANLAYGQMNPVGQYNLPGTPGDGAGGAAIIIQEDRTFIVLAFGTMITGSWVTDGTSPAILKLKPAHPENPFAMFGRNNPDLKEGMRIMYSGGENNDVFMGDYQNAMKRVFNESANCFLSPYIHNQKEIPDTIWFMDTTKVGVTENEIAPGEVYSFSTSGYNEFLVEYYEPARFYYPVMEYEIINDGILVSDKFIKRTKIKNNEDMQFIKSFSARHNSELTTDYKLINADWKVMGGTEFFPDLADYRFDEKGNKYVSKETRDFPDAYYKTDTLYRFNRIPVSKNEAQKIVIVPGSVFYAECGEGF